MDNLQNLTDIRREYGDSSLDEGNILPDPLAQFSVWFDDIVKAKQHDPTAMVLATVDQNGHPDTRVVLLKGIEEGSFIFYTNYQSAKALQIAQTPFAALNFYWPELARQIRIRGEVKKVSTELSHQYFLSRPLKSQLSALASPQSQEIPDRAFLENALNHLTQQHEHQPLTPPIHWGGYRLIPEEIEFWQGRNNRLHDRIQYRRQNNAWTQRRLAP